MNLPVYGPDVITMTLDEPRALAVASKLAPERAMAMVAELQGIIERARLDVAAAFAKYEDEARQAGGNVVPFRRGRG